ncbi:AmmeMemoRadiSam system protein A [Candidatus Woesearchaeota archaeon]|nr:AmmeMemoRadiSam system protein A [Candidatus Woesearchaeota archaeon]
MKETISEGDKKALLGLARNSIKTYFQGKSCPLGGASKFSKVQGVFVTLHDKHGDLRGCIGFPIGFKPLCEGIVDAARHAAFRDPRFPPLRESELAETRIEISVLTVPEEMKVKSPDEYLKKIVIGVDGLILEGPFGSGLLLPQVATENEFGTKEFLNCLCQKAGLPFDSWKDRENKILRFSAEVFSE